MCVYCAIKVDSCQFRAVTKNAYKTKSGRNTQETKTTKTRRMGGKYNVNGNYKNKASTTNGSVVAPFQTPPPPFATICSRPQNHKFTITTQLPQQCTAPRGLVPFDPPSDPVNHQPNNLTANQPTNLPTIKRWQQTNADDATKPYSGDPDSEPESWSESVTEYEYYNDYDIEFGSEELYGNQQGRT